VNHTVDVFHDILQKLREESNQPVTLANIDLDTGDRVKFGDYPLADQTYARLLERLTSKPERSIPEDVRKNIIEFYAASRIIPESPVEVSERLMTLRTMKATTDPK
jgi:hypothetical protein